MIKKVRNTVLFVAIAGTLFLPSFSFLAYADAHDDALAEMELDYYSTANNVWLHPETGINNSTAYNTSGNILQFSGNGNLTGNNNTYDNFDIGVDGDLTIQSGATVNGLTLNQTLGNTQEMANLISLTYGIFWVLTNNYMDEYTSSITINSSYGTVSIPLFRIGGWPGFTFNNSTGVLSPTVSGEYYGTLPGLVNFGIQCLETDLQSFAYLILYNFNNLRADIVSASSLIVSAIQDIQTYNYWTLTPSQDGETFSKTVVSQSGAFHSIILNRCEYIADVLAFYSGRMYEWFYPLDNVDPEYWRYYNTDTKASENIGLAGLMYNISWYLGNLYVLQAANAALDQAEDAVASAAQTFQNVEQQEEAVMNSVNSYIQSFNPSVSDFGLFRAIPWLSNYLQQVWVSLGAYGTVISVGLLLGVCMQVIGYMRYR